MTYGYGDPPDGWPADPDPGPRGRRRPDDGDADGHWPGGSGRQPHVPDARTSQWDTPAAGQAYGAPSGGGYPPPESRGYPPPDRAWGTPPGQYPGPEEPGPRRGQSHLTGRYVPRADGPAVARPPAGPERGWDEPRGRPPQAWQDDFAADRDRLGDADAPGRYDDEYLRQRARGTRYGTPAGDPRTRPGGYPPRPRSGEDYHGDEGPDDFGRRGGRSGPDERRRGPFLPVLAVVATIALLAVCGAGFYVTFVGGKGGPDGNNGATVHDISNQGIDPAPLTVAEVFPAATINPGGSAGDSGSAGAAPSGSASTAASGSVQPYQVVKAETAECKTAVVGDLVTLLANSGCSQVVRATLLTADQRYVVTTGLFNLRDEATAKQVNDEVKGIVNATKGRFTGFMAGGATDVIGRAKTQLAWDTRGHFLIYCVIARADSQEPDPKNPSVTQMVTDLVETYLNETVLTNRTLTPPAVPSSGAPASSAP